PLPDGGGGGIDDGDAAPQNIAFGRAHAERALADGEFRHRPDPDQAGLVLLIAIEVAARERIEHGPLLAAGRNELPLVLADRAGRGRRVRRRKLAAAGLADESGHWRSPAAFVRRSYVHIPLGIKARQRGRECP